MNFELEEPALPDRLVAAGDAAFPALEVEAALGVLHRAGYEAERVVFAPLFAVEAHYVSDWLLWGVRFGEGLGLPLFLEAADR